MNLSEKAQAALDKVVEAFQTGDLSPIIQIATYHIPSDWPSSHWSFANRVLIYAQTGTLHCRGFRQWEEVDRKVKKGARSAYIFGPRTVKEEKDGESLFKLIGWTTIPVFAYDDTEGEEIGLPPEWVPPTPPPLWDVAERFGLTVKYDYVPDARGIYSPNRKRITLATQSEKTWFHELAHAAEHVLLGELVGGQDEKQEAVAEFTAAVLMELYGLKSTTGNAWEYIKGYSTNPLKTIMSVLPRVEAVLGLILQPEYA